MPGTNHEIIQAYRHLYRGALRAVKYAKPARFTVRDRLRTSFRKGSAEAYDQEKIQNTLIFLENAAIYSGLEHKIVRTLVKTWGVHQSRRITASRKKLSDAEHQIKETAMDHFNATIKAFNDTMDMCL